MAKILVIRFSALGDVAMTIPVIYSLAKANPKDEICFLSRGMFEQFFLNMPTNVRFMKAELSGEHKGINGLSKLFHKLEQENFDYIVDLHNVIRSKYLSFRFKIKGKTTATIDKGRKEKRALTRRRNKKFVQLKTTFERYNNVFKKIGYQFPLDFKTILTSEIHQNIDFDKVFESKQNNKWVGIAPFAKNLGKTYPEELMCNVIEKLSQENDIRIFIFGGGTDEFKKVERWIKRYPTIISTINTISLEQQILLMSKLDLMVSMDSGNMHLASLVGTKVVSIWGATHPFAGFLGWNQSIDNVVQETLECRPCSIFGEKACYRGDYKCMELIRPERIINKVKELIRK